MQHMTRRRGSLAVLAAVLVACATSACQPTDDQSSGGPSGSSSAASDSDRTPRVDINSHTCYAKTKPRMHVTASNLTPGIGYLITLDFPSGGQRTISGTADSDGKGSYSFSCKGFEAGTVIVAVRNKMSIRKVGKTYFHVVQAGSVRT